MDVIREKDEVSGEVPGGAHRERDDQYREEGQFGAWLGAECFLKYPESGESSHEKYRGLSTDGAECVGQSLVGQELRDEHDQERPEEKGIGDQSQVTVAVAQTLPEERHRLPNEEEESGQEKGSDERIEYRVGWVVVAPVLIAPEVVFEKRKREGLGKRPREVSLVDFGVENGDIR